MASSYQKRDARVRQIAGAALELIAESGLRRFTTRAIAEKVGITDGTIFRHFKSKDEIVLAAMELLEEKMEMDAFPSDEDALVRLEKFFRRRAALLGGQSSMGRLMFSEQLVHAAGEAGRAKLGAWRQRNRAFVLSCLQELETQERLPKGTEAQGVLVILQGTLLTFAFERVLQDRQRPDLETQIQHSWQTLARLLAPSA